MSTAQNLSYAAIQVVHNFGAVAATGGSLAALALRTSGARKRLVKIVAGGWAVQAVSGALFGAASYSFYQKLPDIEGPAQDALYVKMTCVATALILFATYFMRSDRSSGTPNSLWVGSSVLAVIALTSAAVLRWFS
jgi:hypothetical protein